MLGIQNNRAKLLFYLLVLLIIAYPTIGVLDKMPIRLWDESRNAMNAYEMSENHQWFVTYYAGEPDMWNTKPPLLIWLQVLFIKLIGLNPLAIRLPVALATIALFLFLFQKLSKLSNNFIVGLLVVLVLVCSNGYITEHVTRTGDYDGLLVCWSTMAALYYFSYLQERKPFQFILFALLAALAVWTKGIAGMLLFPGLLLYTIYAKSFKMLWRKKEFYGGILLFVLLVGTVYGLREYHNPGYLAQVAENELGGRFLNTLENHNFPFWFYWENLLAYRWTYWLALFALSIPTLFFTKHNSVKDLGVFCLILIGSFFLIISYSKTKLPWYDALLYPYLAIVVGHGIYYYLQFLTSQNVGKIHKLLLAVSCTLLFLPPYYKVCSIANAGVTKPEDEHLYQLSYFMRTAIEEQDFVNGAFLISDSYIPHADFYRLMAQKNGANISRKSSLEINIGDAVILDNDATKIRIEEKYDLLEIGGKLGYKKYRVNKKDSEAQ